MALVVSKRSLSFLSATQFCCGVLTMDFWCKMPFEAKKIMPEIIDELSAIGTSD